MREQEFIEKRNLLNVSAFWQSKLAVFSPVAVVYLSQLWSRHEQEQAANIEKSKLSNNLSALAHRKAELFKQRRVERAKFFTIPFTPAFDGERAVVSKAVQAIQGQIAAVKKAERANVKEQSVQIVPQVTMVDCTALSHSDLRLRRAIITSQIANKKRHLAALESQDAGFGRLATAKAKLKQLENVKKEIVQHLQNKKKKCN